MVRSALLREDRRNLPLTEALEKRWLLSTGTISGYEFNDLNGDGILQSNEPVNKGVTCYLDKNHDGVYDTGDLQATSNASGSFAFTGLEPGTYYLNQVLRGGYRSTTSLPLAVKVVSGKTTTVNIGNELAGSSLAKAAVTSTGSISGTLYDDLLGLNQHVSSDPPLSEPPLAGWTVYVDVNDVGKFASGDPTAVTSSTGTFTLSGLKNPGNYIVDAEQPSGWARTSSTMSLIYVNSGQAVTGQYIGYQNNNRNSISVLPDGTLVVLGSDPNPEARDTVDENISISLNLATATSTTGTADIDIQNGDDYENIAYTSKSLANVKRIFVQGGGGNDNLFIYYNTADYKSAAYTSGAHIQATLVGGGGNDTLAGNCPEDWLYGGVVPGQPVTYVSQFDRNILTDGSGRDHYFGGEGANTVDYSNTYTPQSIYLDGSRSSGTTGTNEGDTFEDRDVETVLGGQGGDLIVGDLSAADKANPPPNVLFGGYGNDTIIGGYGPDALFGENGNDILDGSRGENDYYVGGDYSTNFSDTIVSYHPVYYAGGTTKIAGYYTKVGAYYVGGEPQNPTKVVYFDPTDLTNISARTTEITQAIEGSWTPTSGVIIS